MRPVRAAELARDYKVRAAAAAAALVAAIMAWAALITDSVDSLAGAGPAGQLEQLPLRHVHPALRLRPPADHQYPFCPL